MWANKGFCSDWFLYFGFTTTTFVRLCSDGGCQVLWIFFLRQEEHSDIFHGSQYSRQAWIELASTSYWDSASKSTIRDQPPLPRNENNILLWIVFSRWYYYWFASFSFVQVGFRVNDGISHSTNGNALLQTSSKEISFQKIKWQSAPFMRVSVEYLWLAAAKTFVMWFTL